MSEPSLSDSSTNPDQAVVSSQQAQPLVPQNAQGSATLDAQAGGNHPQGEPANAPIATNFSDVEATGDPKTAGVSGEMGAFSKDAPLAEKGSVNLHNNPEIPNDQNDSPQGKMPDTDSIGMPTDPATNLPD